MIAAKALEKRTVEQRNEMAALRKETDARTEALKAENADLKARLDALERRVGSYARASNDAYSICGCNASLSGAKSSSL